MDAVIVGAGVPVVVEEEPGETEFEGDIELERVGIELIVGVGGMGVREKEEDMEGVMDEVTSEEPSGVG